MTILSPMTHERRMSMILEKRSSTSRKILGGRDAMVERRFTGLLEGGGESLEVLLDMGDKRVR